MKVEFHELDDSVKLKFSVIVAKDENGFVCVRHKDRDTWEAPGGHLEHGETPRAAAERELKEETGAESFCWMKYAIIQLESATLLLMVGYASLKYSSIQEV